ncbi:hypothetical protein WDW89_14495 [Deltaproteobacteria bacterium TL4]
MLAKIGMDHCPFEDFQKTVAALMKEPNELKLIELTQHSYMTFSKINVIHDQQKNSLLTK